MRHKTNGAWRTEEPVPAEHIACLVAASFKSSTLYMNDDRTPPCHAQHDATAKTSSPRPLKGRINRLEAASSFPRTSFQETCYISLHLPTCGVIFEFSQASKISVTPKILEKSKNMPKIVFVLWTRVSKRWSLVAAIYNA